MEGSTSLAFKIVSASCLKFKVEIGKCAIGKPKGDNQTYMYFALFMRLVMKAKKALRRGGPKTFTTNFPFHFDASQQRQVKTCEQICRIAKMTFSILLKLLLEKIMLRDHLIGLSFRLDLRREDISFVSNLHFQYFHRIEVKRLYEIFFSRKGSVIRHSRGPF